MESYRVQILIEQDEDGLYVAECPALAGCYSQGATVDEALANVREVIAMCIEELREDGKPVETRYPEIIEVRMVDYR